MNEPTKIKRGDPHRFPCGHRREPSNMTREEWPCCLACKRLRYLDGKTSFKCGHPITPENTRFHGVKNKYRRCRTCDNERQQEVNRRVRGMAKQVEARKARSIPVTAPVLVCRIERQKREQAGPSEAIREAQAEYQAMLAREAIHRKGGRPHKVKPQVHAQRSTDLCDYLPAYYGRSA